MPLSDDRYFRDLRRYGLAFAMLRQAARPSTVRAWTGFSRQRMRQVIRSYARNRSETDPRCEPGPPPAALGKLVKNVDLRRELTAAAGLCLVLKLIPHTPIKNAAARFPSVEAGERLCHVFDVYRQGVPNARLTLEQLIVLIFALVEGADWALERCSNCRSTVLIDPLSLERRLCEECRIPAPTARASHTHIEEQLPPIPKVEPSGVGEQQSLF